MGCKMKACIETALRQSNLVKNKGSLREVGLNLGSIGRKKMGSGCQVSVLFLMGSSCMQLPEVELKLHTILYTAGVRSGGDLRKHGLAVGKLNIALNSPVFFYFYPKCQSLLRVNIES